MWSTVGGVTVPLDDRARHARGCYSVWVARLVERYPATDGWSHAALIEPGSRYELAASKAGHGFVARVAAPGWDATAALDSPGPAFTGCLLKAVGFLVGGAGSLALALVAPPPGISTAQITLFGAFLGAIVAWLVSIVVVGALSARNPFPPAELEAVRAELAGLLAGGAVPEVDLLALVKARFDVALDRRAAATTPQAARAAFQEACDLSVLARTLAPLYGDAREAEIADLAARRERARADGPSLAR
jgi:hypothetical protein